MALTSCHSPAAATDPAPVAWPKITVVTPSLNQGEFLERAIQSVLAQDYPTLEFLIFDAGSTDGSREILEQFGGRLTYWTSEPDRGQSDAIVKGWQRAGGEILTWLNSDDYYYENALREVGQFFARHPEIVMLCGAVALVDPDGKVRRIKAPPPMGAEPLLCWSDVPGQPGTFLRREVFEQLGGPRLDLHYMMDWELWLRVALHYPPAAIARTGALLAADRQWQGTKTMNAGGKSGAEVRQVLTELFAAQTLPPQLQRLERRALARAWWRQSKGELNESQCGSALISLLRAVRLSPGSFPPLKVLRQFRRILSRSCSRRTPAARAGAHSPALRFSQMVAARGEASPLRPARRSQKA